MDEILSKKKSHRSPHSGRKAEKKKTKEEKIKKYSESDPKLRNPKAFAINSVRKAERQFRRTRDIETKKQRVPLVDRTPVEAPPFIVAIVGPPKVGKSTLFRNLTKNFTRQTLTTITGPVTIVSGKKRRLTLVECNNDINSMVDIAKVADLALLLIDASFGFEMEIFEFLNICQVHGFPQIMGVLTHLDMFKNKKKLKKTKKTLKHRFWTEVYPGSKLFYLSGFFQNTQSYPKNEIHNLSRFISVMKFRQTVWKSEHSYVVADRMEDLTNPDSLRLSAKADRTISLYGYVRGTFLKQNAAIHIPGLGDFQPKAITVLPDPCPLPQKESAFKRSLNEKEKLLYAPFSGVGGIVYDKDAVYIDLGGSHSHRNEMNKRNNDDNESNNTTDQETVSALKNIKATLHQQMNESKLKIFSTSKELSSAAVDSTEIETNIKPVDEDPVEMLYERSFETHVAEDGRTRRKVLFKNDADDLIEDDDITQDLGREILRIKSSSQKSGSDENSDELENESDDSNDSELDKIENNTCIDNIDTPVKDVAKGEMDINPFALANKLKNRISDSKSFACTEQNEHENDANKSDNREEYNMESDETDEEDDSEYQIIPDKNKKSRSNEKISNKKKAIISDAEDESEEADDESEEDDVGELDEEDVDHLGGSDEEMMEEKPLDDDDLEAHKKKRENKFTVKEKEERYLNAETAYFSRFKNRSMQKMIYDEEDDFLNMKSAEDFDNANFNLGRNTTLNEELLKNEFVGGDYSESAQQILEDDEMFEDDFEELDRKPDQRGVEESFEDDTPINVIDKMKSKEEIENEKRAAIKKKLKQKFDIEYDEGGEKDYYKEWKSQVEEQTKLNKTMYEDLNDEELLHALQGFSPGSYVRVEIDKIPSEFIDNFHPQECCPLIMGSLDSPNQETLAVVQARVKKHRWFPKILKTRDPIILSVGWRRFQTISLYSVHDHNMRNRMIKYTPEHLHCISNFYGPVTPQGTGILGLAPQGFSGFRICLTGAILDLDKSTELVKKLKLIGHPSKIYKKSAFIEGMFSSQLEAAKFTGAKLKSVSGVRGVIKKPLRAPEGAFRATFEDKILSKDIVFCRTWAKIDIPKFFLNLPTMITKSPRVARTVGELKRIKGIKIEPNPDHLYTPVEHAEQRFRPLKVPKALQEKLPYQQKPKVAAKVNKLQRVAVIRDPEEKKMDKLIKTMKQRAIEKKDKHKELKRTKDKERKKELGRQLERQTRRQKELRKQVFRALGKMEKSKEENGKRRKSFKRR